MSTPQRPLEPDYWCDRSVGLYEGALLVRYGRHKVQYMGSVTIDWNPRPTVRWHGSTNQRSDIPAVANHLFGDEGRPQLLWQHGMPPAPRRRGAGRVADTSGELSDHGSCDGLDFRDAGGVCDRVTFNLINGPDLLPLVGLQRRGLLWSGRWLLNDGRWKITLDARPSLSNLIRDLRDTRGHSFTHVGLLERVDKGDFGPDEAQEVLNDLFLFLTFVRGALVGISVPVGRRHNQVTWRRWTTGLSSPYTNAFSWGDPHTPADIAALWPMLRTARADSRWSNALLRAIRHYAEANQAVAAEVQLTLAQAALELLGTAVCVDRDRELSFAKWDRRSADWRIRRLLHRWGDGPVALTALRNTVTHWTTGKPQVDAQVWAEAAQLGLHYLEMALLAALGYQGRAFDRTQRPLIRGGSSRVPWASLA